MRVVGGELRGRVLRVPDLEGLRPTSSRVREAIFDALEARSLVTGARVLDLFAGSGALGIEALSRGAESCLFVESDRRLAACIEQNLDALGLGGPGSGARVVRAEVLSFLGSLATSHDLALVDPPYSFASWPELLARLPVRTAVLEHSGGLAEVSPFQTLRSYRHGGTLFTLVAAHSIDEDLA